MRVLVVEDERKIAGFLERGLTDEGHVVDVASDLAQARTALGAHDYDLLLVDRMLPDGDGLSIVRELRREGSSVPTICLTAKDRVEERVEGLYGGADDYIVKPFAFDELLARIAAVQRRAGGADVLEIADLRVDVPARRVFRGGVEIRLTAQEFALLRYLAERTGRVMSRTRLLSGVWDTMHDPGTNIVDVYISYLRAKIDKDFDRPLLHTVRGVGYVLEDRPR
ncbi:MAG: response regulator transcription factor [Myxococcales bacterium]|nr:response regulator transcription factor [Myxococcales bacterium]MCB9673430.1 response regulator transcription factor [Alphaproteobacteria bacterium]MCB9686040.1 response regulator transcription factor [Alphaproteobacteria bacterium]